ncbi:serine/threonine protein phosphatase [Candidatus Micrarchaeota archaeon]|nr:serine/threonine protein phosphatase [Candidatus Micrarchaeota archaeon]
MAQDEAMLTRLANEAKKLEQDDAYTELAMLARFSGSSAIIDSSASTKFDFDKCIAPYTTPGFVFTTAAFVGAAMLTGGAGFPALAGAAGDAMMVHGAISLIQSKDAGMTRRLCDFAFISTGVAFGHTSIKIRQQALKLSPEQIPALGKKIKTPEALAKTLGKEVKASELVKAIVESIRVKGETTGVTVKSGANLLKGVRETAKLSKKESGYTVECASACYTGTAGEDYTSTGYYGQTPPEITGKYDFHPGNIKRGSGEYIDIGNIRYGYIYRTSVGNSWFYSLYDAPVFVYTKGKTLFLQKGERAAIPRDAQIQVGTTLIVTHPSWGWRHAKPKLERLGKAVKGIGEPFRWAAEELASFARKITATHPKTAYKLRFANGEEWSVSYGEPIYIGSASNNHLVPNIEFLDAYHGKIIAYEDGHLVYFEGVHAPVTNPSKIIQYINGGWREVGVTAQMIEAPIRLTDGYGVVLADGTAISTEGVWTAEGVKWVEFKPRSSKSTESAKQAEKTTGRAKETSRGKQKSETKRVLARPARSAAQEISFVQETTNVLRSTSNRDGNLIRIDARNAKVVTLGDIHGDYNTLAATLSETRIADRLANGENVFLLFLGDIVDRATSADKQFAVTNTVLELVKTYPDRVVLLRGNHEHLAQTARYGFENDVIQTFGRTGVSEAYQSLFNELPIAALIDNGYSRTLAVHGFIPTREAFAPGADKISQLARASAESPIGKQTLWNDPTTGDTASGNRGSNDFYKISQADTEAFMRENGITYILRAHEEVPGFKDVYGDQRVFNLFSNNEHYTGGGRGYAVLEPQGSVIVGNAGGQRYRYQSEPYEQNWQQRTNGQNEQQSQANEPTNPSTLFTRKWSPTTEQAREYLKTDVPELESNFYKVTEGYISLKPEKAPQKDALKAKIRQLFNKYHPDKAYNDIALKRDYNSIMIELNTLMAALNR